MSQNTNYTKAISLINEVYTQDTDIIEHEGVSISKELLYAHRMVQTLAMFKPDATEELILAAHCQHLYRWEIPRKSYPMDRKGYHQWRTFLYSYQANKTALLLKEAGYNANSIEQVTFMMAKTDLKNDANSQTLEDVVCLVFLEFYLDAFIEQHKSDSEKLKRIIQNTWLKMSKKGHASALQIPFTPESKTIVLEAIGS